MIKQIQHQSIRAVAAVAAAVVLVAGAATSSAQTLGTNIFGGPIGTNPAALTVTSLVGSNLNSGPFGPGFNGTVNLGLGTLTSLQESINGGTYTITEGGVAGLSGNFSAFKEFAGSSFVGGQYYQLTLTRSANSALNVLSGFDIRLSTTSNNVTTVALDTATGTGLLGVTNVLGLFGTSDTAAIVFQAPANFPTTPITATFTGSLTTSALTSTFVFTSASVQAVPEPATVAMLGTGLGLVVLARFRRRSA